MSTLTQKTPTAALTNTPVDVKLILATLWASFMFLYIYVDYFTLYTPQFLREIMAGKVWKFEITELFLVGALASVTVPTLMVFLSVALPAPANRRTNLWVAAAYIPYSLFNLAGEASCHMVLGAVVETALLLAAIWHAWNWPTQPMQPMQPVQPHAPVLKN